ncbi:hypothetical protein [Planctomyces sp. SH-PL62]|uniref:hypothetical protein n=1 Tax=Planctomyces sp. SH-PL62 TaxID=1636152 RepID=UPI00078CF1CB|nr:hypothetical protein [Planctomyces sp. SH-PL62]AMV38424.1 hypothetical protein VT85_13385 [Planctomyces sp. SH-PL62]
MPFEEPPEDGINEPKFTINAFMRYLSANASGREAITLQQKYPSAYQAVYYDAASDVLRRYIDSGMGDDAILDEGIAAIRAASTEDKGPHNIRANVEVVEAFRDRRPKLSFGGLSPSTSPGPQMSLVIAGVELVIQPEILLEGVIDGEMRGGAVKFYFSKGHPLTSPAASYGALLLQRYCEANLPDRATVQNRQCIICDVRVGEVHHSPEATVRREREIEAACAEIAVRWPATSPPGRP